MLAAVLGGDGAPQRIRAHCSWCCDITQHTLKIHNTIRRSIYTCGGCSKDTLPCKQCSQSATAEEMGMAKDTPMYSHDRCLVCDGTMAAWDAIEEADPPDPAPDPSPEHVLGTLPVESQSGSDLELGQGVATTGARHLAITGATVAAAAALTPVAPAAGAILAVGAVTAAVTAKYVNSSGEPQLRAPSTTRCVFAAQTPTADGPSATCWKKRGGLVNVDWPERYIHVRANGQGGTGLFVYTKRGDTEPRESSIESLQGCAVETGTESWTLGGEKSKLTLSGGHLSEAVHFAFEELANRDAIAAACADAAAGQSAAASEVTHKEFGIEWEAHDEVGTSRSPLRVKTVGYGSIPAQQGLAAGDTLLRITCGQDTHSLRGKSHAEVWSILRRAGDQPLSLDFLQFHGLVEDAQDMLELPWLLEEIVKLKDEEAEEGRRQLEQQLKRAGERAKAAQRLNEEQETVATCDMRRWETKNKQLREQNKQLRQRMENAERQLAEISARARIIEIWGKHGKVDKIKLLNELVTEAGGTEALLKLVEQKYTVSEPEPELALEPAPEPESDSRDSNVAQLGGLQCQFTGKGDFIPVWLSLTGETLTFYKSDELSTDNILCSTCVTSCSIREPKTQRPGHEIALRLDTAKPDTSGHVKYILSMKSLADKKRLSDALADFTRYATAIRTADHQDWMLQIIERHQTKRWFRLRDGLLQWFEAPGLPMFKGELDLRQEGHIVIRNKHVEPIEQLKRTPFGIEIVFHSKSHERQAYLFVCFTEARRKIWLEELQAANELPKKSSGGLGYANASNRLWDLSHKPSIRAAPKGFGESFGMMVGDFIQVAASAPVTVMDSTKKGGLEGTAAGVAKVTLGLADSVVDGVYNMTKKGAEAAASFAPGFETDQRLSSLARLDSGPPAHIASVLSRNTCKIEMTDTTERKLETDWKGTIFYKVDIRLPGTTRHEWSVYRRNKHFEELKKDVAEKGQRSAVLFPEQGGISWDEKKKVQHRMEGFERYLNSLLSVDSLRTDGHVVAFLTPREGDIFPSATEAATESPVRLQAASAVDTHVLQSIRRQQQEFADREFIANSMILHWERAESLLQDRKLVDLADLRRTPTGVMSISSEEEYSKWLNKHDPTEHLKEFDGGIRNEPFRALWENRTGQRTWEYTCQTAQGTLVIDRDKIEDRIGEAIDAITSVDESAFDAEPDVEAPRTFATSFFKREYDKLKSETPDQYRNTLAAVVVTRMSDFIRRYCIVHGLDSEAQLESAVTFVRELTEIMNGHESMKDASLLSGAGAAAVSL